MWLLVAQVLNDTFVNQLDSLCEHFPLLKVALTHLSRPNFNLTSSGTMQTEFIVIYA